MAQELKLHGGPWHHREVITRDGVNFFYIAEQPDLPTFTEGDGSKTLEAVAIRRGSYSRVGKTTDFEWDGWRS